MVLAIACRQAGLAVRLYESQTTETQDPALLVLTANGSRVLHALGLKQALTAAASEPQFAAIRGAATGFMLSQRPLGAFSVARYGAPCYLIEAQALHALLRTTCEATDIPLEQPVTVTGIDTESGSLTLADGTRRQHLAVALASGTPDAGEAPGLANLLEARTWAVDRDITVIRARCRRRGHDRDHDRFINTWLLSGGYCLELPVPDGSEDPQIVELTAVVGAPAPALAADAALSELLSNAHPVISSFTEQIEQAAFVERPSAPVAEYWQAGRTVMLGGICHAPVGFDDLGTCAALEDAWILSRMMERWEEEPHQDFAEYERFRKPRARRLRAFAETEREVQSLSSGTAIWQRNIRWSLTSRFLPEIAMHRLDWLYGYDCIRGFA